MKVTKDMVIKGVKIISPILTLGAAALASYVSKEDLKEQINNGIAEKLAEMNKKES